MSSSFDPAEFAMLMNNGYFGVPDEKLEEIAKIMQYQGLDLSRAAWSCDIDPANLTAKDRAAIREYFDSEDEEE